MSISVKKYNTIATIRAEKKRKKKVLQQYYHKDRQKKHYTKKSKWYALHEGDKFNHSKCFQISEPT